MEVASEIAKIVLLAVLVLLVPFLFMLIFDLAAHLGDLFGHRRS
ncbi:MAG: hypothetical protein NZL87_06970 [Thermomicrobium sp.]|nr:hypothetical protein [Thermomicrobium sp.]MCS7246443.1 hypothetical protein [Thermomicrobium sp.]MDW7982843.1 hypothetical protein [Thermomicrobium sp.]